MSAVHAMLWADYLSIDPAIILEATGLIGHRTQIARVSHYLETTQWAHKYLHARDRLKSALHTAERLAHASPQAGGLREDALSLKSAISDVLTLLRVPSKPAEESNEPT